MKKILTIISLFAFTAFIFSSCEKIETEVKKEKKYPAVEVLNIWENFEKNFSVLWEVFPQKESVSTSKISDWVVQKIYVKNWDKVRKWQVLLEIKSDKTSQNYSNAKNNYNKAVASWNQAVKSAEVNLANAENIFEKQKAEFANSLSSSKISANLSIENAESNLNSTISLNEKTEKTSRENLENAVNSAKILSENSLNEVDKILWIEDVNEENAVIYENYLWTLKSETLTTAEKNYRLSKNYFDENINSSDYLQNLEILKYVKKSADSNLSLLQNSTTWPSFTNTELQALISSTSTLVNTLQSSINNLISLKNSLDSTIESNNKNLASAKNALEIAKMSWENWTSQSVNLAESSYEKNLANLENSIKSSEQALQSAKTSSQQNIASMLSNLKNAELAVKDLRVTADFSWEVSDLFVDNWDNVSNWTKLVSVSNNAKFKIVTYLSKDQVSWISQWDDVKIWKSSMDYISSVSWTSDSSTKKFKVEIVHENPFLSAWQFIDLKFSRKNFIWTNKIFLDLPTVFVTDSENFVWVIEKTEWKIWTIQKRIVELWWLSWNQIEILSWLERSDQVITWWHRFLKKDWDEVEVL